MQKLVGLLFLPPLNLLILALIGGLVHALRPRLGFALIYSCLLGLWLFSTPLVANFLLESLTKLEPSHDRCTPQAIVVLGAGTRFAHNVHERDSVSAIGLERLRLAAEIQRHTKLPILVSGGNPDRRPLSEAQLMKEALIKDFQVPVQWAEESSNNTFENAVRSREILAREQIGDIYLVTQDWHLPRATFAFVRAGFCVTPAPILHSRRGHTVFSDLLPQADALLLSFYFTHEAIGLVWYLLTS